METVQDPMREGRDKQGRNTNKRQPRKQRVTGSENLSCRGMERIHRTHSTQNHGRVQERVDPAQPCDKVVTEDADAQTDSKELKRETKLASDEECKFLSREETMVWVLVRVRFSPVDGNPNPLLSNPVCATPLSLQNLILGSA